MNTTTHRPGPIGGCRRRRQVVGVGRGQHPHLADAAVPPRVCPPSGGTPGRRKMDGVGGGVLDHHPLRHRRAPRPDVSDRMQCHQRSHHRRNRPRAGRLREAMREGTKSHGPCTFDTPSAARSAPAAFLRHCLRYAASVAGVRRALRRDHGRRRFHRLLPRRLSQHAGAFVHRASQAVRLRHHHHGQP